jgi:hypothetical protein
MVHTAPTGSAWASQVPSARQVPVARHGSSLVQSLPVGRCVLTHAPVVSSHEPTKHGPLGHTLREPAQPPLAHVPTMHLSVHAVPLLAGFETQPPAPGSHNPARHTGTTLQSTFAAPVQVPVKHVPGWLQALPPHGAPLSSWLSQLPVAVLHCDVMHSPDAHCTLTAVQVPPMHWCWQRLPSSQGSVLSGATEHW